MPTTSPKAQPTTAQPTVDLALEPTASTSNGHQHYHHQHIMRHHVDHLAMNSEHFTIANDVKYVFLPLKRFNHELM